MHNLCAYLLFHYIAGRLCGHSLYQFQLCITSKANPGNFPQQYLVFQNVASFPKIPFLAADKPALRFAGLCCCMGLFSFLQNRCRRRSLRTQLQILCFCHEKTRLIWARHIIIALRLIDNQKTTHMTGWIRL